MKAEEGTGAVPCCPSLPPDAGPAAPPLLARKAGQVCPGGSNETQVEDTGAAAPGPALHRRGARRRSPELEVRASGLASFAGDWRGVCELRPLDNPPIIRVAFPSAPRRSMGLITAHPSHE